MNRFISNSRSFKLHKLSTRYNFLLIIILMIILWLYQRRINLKEDSVSVSVSVPSSCHIVNIYGLTNQTRCYPLLVNFAHQCCRQSQQDNCDTGLASGIKQCVKLNMDIFKFDEDYRRRNNDILSRSRGAGYWIWKSYILWHELYVAREGDIIVYSDAGVNFTAHIDKILPFMPKQDVLMFKQTHHNVCIHK
jgi:hypothetical protein